MKFIFSLIATVLYFSANAQHYWQQKVDTKIEVTLDDKNHFLRGHEELFYTNNSPDTLTYLYFHLYPNAYQHDHTQLAEQLYRNGKKEFYYTSPKNRGFIDSLDFTIDGQSAIYINSDKEPDVARIELPQPIPPGEIVVISTPFRVKIPKVFSRLGHDGQAYYISQWFPKPAVYDSKGWHQMPYLELGEFFSEFGNYEVQITIPENYVVLATGNIVDNNEQLWLDSLSTVDIFNIDSARLNVKSIDSFPASASRMKTIRFKEENVHDFAWFADKRWLVRKDSFEQNSNKQKIYSYTAFLPSSKSLWRDANKHLKNTLEHYGKWIGSYPYKTIKAVEGIMKSGGGMEYPTITIIDKNSSGDQTTIIHEAGHNWFYGILGSNEREHAWMDEGLNTFYEQKTSHSIADSYGTKANNAHDDFDNIILYQLAASGEDAAIDQNGIQFKELNYGMDVYFKTALLLHWLEKYMGEKSFDSAIHHYFNQWKFKHPYPELFQHALELHTNKSVDWFFEALKSKELIDFGITQVVIDSENVLITVKNNTNIPMLPAALEFYLGDSLVHTEINDMKWGNVYTNKQENGKEYIIAVPKENLKCDKVKIASFIPDGKTTNNDFSGKDYWHGRGIKIGHITGLNLLPKERLFIAPTLGYNLYDGLQVGLLFHNFTWPETKFKFALAPLWGFSSNQINGTGSIGYDWHLQQSRLKNITLQLDAKSFSYNQFSAGYSSDSLTFSSNKIMLGYTKIAPSINFTFREKSALSPVHKTLLLKGYSISEDDLKFQLNTKDSVYNPSKFNSNSVYGLVRYEHQNNRPFNPFSYVGEIQLSQNFIKITAETNWRLDYNRKNKSLYIRAFVGKFFEQNSTISNRYYLNTTFTGQNDYLYDDTYSGRNESQGTWSKQISMREGGFKIPTNLYSQPIGQSNNWLATLNIKTDLPIKIPLQLFLDLGTFADAEMINPSGQKMLYDGGICLSISNFFQVNLPLIVSKDFSDYQSQILGKTGVFENVSFSLQLHNFNWLKLSSKTLNLMTNFK